jgi:GDP-mannose 6-dehydrogenase
VGCVSVACLAKAGYKVIGVDVNASKIDLINKGIATIVEPNLDQLLKQGVESGLIEATLDSEYAIARSDVVLITVGTPSTKNGGLDLSHIFSVAREVGEALKIDGRFLTVAIRSTVKPGTCLKVIEIIEEISSKKFGEHFSVVANPEFLREGTAISDYEKPPYILIGSDDDRGAKEICEIYASLAVESIIVPFSSAEILKYINNSWHALKVAFGNEIGSICKSLDIDSHQVMNLFFRDRILNISPHYMHPGYAFGGACLPKDLSALVSLAEAQHVDTPLLQNIQVSNDAHIQRAVNLIKKHPITSRLGFFGVSFKTGTDDLRNSPTLEVITQLIKAGYSICIFDEYVNLALSSGRNTAVAREILGSIEASIVHSESEFLEHSDVIVVAKREPSFDHILSKLQGRFIIDLVHLKGIDKHVRAYSGLAW